MPVARCEKGIEYADWPIGFDFSSAFLSLSQIIDHTLSGSCRIIGDTETLSFVFSPLYFVLSSAAGG